MDKIQDPQGHLEFMESTFVISPNQEMKYYVLWWDALNILILNRSPISGETEDLLAAGVGFD